jgi:hypothetical protein
VRYLPPEGEGRIVATMLKPEAERVVALLGDPAQWDWDDYSRACRGRVQELSAVERTDGTWAVRLLFQQGAYRMGVETGRLELWTTQEPCTPDDLAQELRMFAVEEPHGPSFGEMVDEHGRHWLIE